MADCNFCLSGNTDFDYSPEFVDTKDVRARKPFKCCECRRQFPAGTIYERTSGKWEDKVDTIKTCMDCADIRSTFYCDSGGSYGELWSDFYESDGYENLTTACIAKLQTASAKQYLIQRWQKWKFKDAS